MKQYTADERRKWSASFSNTYAMEMRKLIKPGDRIKIIWLDGKLKPLEAGMIGIVASHDRAACRCIFQGTRFVPGELATLYWREIELVRYNTLEHHLKRMVAG